MQGEARLCDDHTAGQGSAASGEGCAGLDGQGRVEAPLEELLLSVSLASSTSTRTTVEGACDACEGSQWRRCLPPQGRHSLPASPRIEERRTRKRLSGSLLASFIEEVGSGCFTSASFDAHPLARAITSRLSPPPQADGESREVCGRDAVKVTTSHGTTAARTAKRRLSDYRMERDLGQGAYAFVKEATLIERSMLAPPPPGGGGASLEKADGDEERQPVAPCSKAGATVVIKMVIKSKLLPECILHDFETGLSLPVELYLLRHLMDYPHDHIVPMVEAFEDVQYYYIVMPLHGAGRDLFESIEGAPDFFSTDRIAFIFSQVVMAVSHLHDVLGVIHRDIKDENIIIDDRNICRLIDFGSAAYYRQGGSNVQDDVPLTEADVLRGKREVLFTSYHGTLEYAPPEIVKGMPYEGPPQDMWTLGVLLYTLTFKEVPFRTAPDIVAGRLRWPFQVDEHIVELIKSLLQGDPHERPTARHLASHPWIVEHYGRVVEALHAAPLPA